jgi:hypothetical protein
MRYVFTIREDEHAPVRLLQIGKREFHGGIDPRSSVIARASRRKVPHTRGEVKAIMGETSVYITVLYGDGLCGSSAEPERATLCCVGGWSPRLAGQQVTTRFAAPVEPRPLAAT